MKKLFILFLLFMLSSAKGQEIQTFLEKVQDFASNNPIEKVYLHTDKPSYSAGDNIFFKSYCTVGVQNLFSNWSGVLYAELVSPSDEIVKRVTIPTPMGIGLGDFTLPDTLTEGIYRLRAYTNWMKNAGSEYYFSKRIPIYNGRSDNVITKTSYTIRPNDILYQIDLRNIYGAAVAKTKINYTITDGEKVVEKKSTNSTVEGVIEIPVNKKYKEPIIKLRFENGNKGIVNKIIRASGLEEKRVTTVFPEGGKLVAGRINNVAIKSINNLGLGVKSTVVFKKGTDTLGVVQTNKLGMGATALVLSDTSRLEVICVYEDGAKELISMPKIYSDGFSLRVNSNSTNRIYAQVDISDDLIDNSDLYFVAQHMGEVLFVSRAKISKSDIVFSLEKASLPIGVITLSILDNNFKPILERPIFHYREDKVLRVEVGLNKKTYSTRDKVAVDLLFDTLENGMHLGAFSASVIDLRRVDTSLTNEANILAGLLLKGDVRGHIEDPNYYFEKDFSVRYQDLDLLLLTQGWRNIDWNKIDESADTKYKSEKALKISGYTKKIGRSKPEANAKVQLISTKNFMDFLDTTSNEEGYFEFTDLIFPDSVKFLISAKDAAKGKNNIDIIYNADQPSLIQKDSSSSILWWDVNTKYLEDLRSSKAYFEELERSGLKDKAILIEEIVVTARKKPKASEHSSNLNGPGNADQVIGTDDLGTCPTLELCLSGRLVGVYFQNGVPYSTRGNVPMQVIMDGMYIEPENLSMVNINDIESVEVLRNVSYTAIYGSNGGNGLIIITSKHGSSALNNYVPKGILTLQPQGFQVIKEFYKPVYDVEDGLKFNSDLRSTVHWEPSIVSSKEGKASFNFFTSDSKGKYLMSIEGIDISGRILKKDIEIIVE